MESIGTEHILQSSCLLEELGHGALVGVDISAGLLHGVEALGQMITQTQLEFHTSQGTVKAERKRMIQ